MSRSIMNGGGFLPFKRGTGEGEGGEEGKSKRQPAAAEVGEGGNPPIPP